MSRIISVIRNRGYNELVRALEAANLSDMLNEENPLTVFAPTDEAFATVEREVLWELFANRELLADVMSYHIVPGYYTANDLQDKRRLTTLEGSSLVIHADKRVRVAETAVTQPDIKADNGIIHAIDWVILVEQFFATYGLTLLQPILDIGLRFVGREIPRF